MYNFDEIIDRRHTNAMNTDGYRDYIFHGELPSFPCDEKDLVRMWIADMDFAAADVIIDAVKARLDHPIFGYTKLFTDDYYNAFSAWCRRRYGWTFPKEELRLSPGVVTALFRLSFLLLSANDSVLITAPSYAPFKEAAVRSGSTLLCSDLIRTETGYEIDFADFEAKAADPKTKLLIFCNPHNPTGRVWTQEELTKVADIVRKYNLWIISDEIHCDLLRTGKTHIPMGKILTDYDRLITCMAPSKTFNIAGFMVSNIIIRNADLRRAWETLSEDLLHPLSLAAAQAAYEKGEPWLTALCSYLDDNFALAEAHLKKHLPEGKFFIPEATYLGWADLSAYFDPSENLPLFFAEKAGVLLEGGPMFVHNSDGCIRLNLACPRSVLQEGLTRITEAVNKKS